MKATLDTSGISLTGVKFSDDEDKKAIKQMTKNQFQDTVCQATFFPNTSPLRLSLGLDLSFNLGLRLAA